MAGHAAARRLTVDVEHPPLSEVRTAWAPQNAVPHGNLVLVPSPPWDARRRYWILITGFGSTRRRRWSVMGVPPAPALRLEGRCRR